MSTIKVDTWQDRAGTQDFYGALAWVNFNGTSTPAIRASGNVSSITDNGTGDYTVNFSNALADGNYGVCGTVGTYGVTNAQGSLHVQTASTSAAATTKTASALRIVTGTGSTGALVDYSETSLVILR